MSASRQPGSVARLEFVDNLRAAIIILVISMHAADTYSPFGNWYYADPARTPQSIATLLGTYQSLLQSFFMGLLFAIAGYFAAGSLARKGPGQFMRDRAWRLGIPVLLYMFAIGPVTEYWVAHSWRPDPPTSFAYEWWHHIVDGEVASESGPLWFCVALLAFSAAYAIAKSTKSTDDARPPVPARSQRDPRPGRVLAFAALMALGSFVVRLAFPAGRSVLNLQLGDFVQYASMFVVGLLARRTNWPALVPTRTGNRWLLAAVSIGLPSWWALIWWGGALHGELAAFGGGWHWQALARDMWDAFMCVAVSLGAVTWFRDHCNGATRFTRLFSENAFAVYVFHPPLLILVTLGLTSWANAPALGKFALATIGGSAVTLAFSELVARRTPVLREVL